MVYYAYCKRQKKEAEWTENRKGSELDEEMSKLFERYLDFLLRKKIETKNTRIHEFGDKIVEIDDNDLTLRKIPLKTILPDMLNNALSNPVIFKKDASIIAKKYLATRFARNRVIFIIYFNEKKQKLIGIIISELTDEGIRNLDIASHSIRLELIKNYLPSKIKKGAIFPAIIQNKPELNKIKIFQTSYADYFPNSLETRPELTRSEQFSILSSIINQVQQEKGEKFTSESLVNLSEKLQKIPQDQIPFKKIDEVIGEISDKKIKISDISPSLTGVSKNTLDKFKEIGQISKDVLSETAIEIKMEEAKITFPNKYIIEKNFFIFEKEGKIYIVIEGMNPRIRSDGKAFPNLSPISWDKFKKIIEGTKE